MRRFPSLCITVPALWFIHQGRRSQIRTFATQLGYAPTFSWVCSVPLVLFWRSTAVRKHIVLRRPFAISVQVTVIDTGILYASITVAPQITSIRSIKWWLAFSAIKQIKSPRMSGSYLSKNEAEMTLRITVYVDRYPICGRETNPDHITPYRQKSDVLSGLWLCSVFTSQSKPKKQYAGSRAESRNRSGFYVQGLRIASIVKLLIKVQPKRLSTYD